jgi:putative two-component system response regulator
LSPKTKNTAAAKILMVDDEENNLVVLERLLRQGGYSNLYSTTDSRTTLRLYDQILPDMVFLDLHMPEPDGFQLLEELAKRRPEEAIYLPVLVLTADITPATKLKTLALGANDFLTKPIERCELLLRTRNLLETRFLHKELAENTALLTETQRRAADAEASLGIALERLARAGEYLDLEAVLKSS